MKKDIKAIIEAFDIKIKVEDVEKCKLNKRYNILVVLNCKKLLKLLESKYPDYSFSITACEEEEKE